jgi:hypothetical protein
LLFIIAIITIFTIYYNLPPNKKATNNYQCNGWRNYFIPNDEEKRIFQSVRMEHIQLLEKLEETTEKLDSINKLIPIRGKPSKHVK